MEFKKKSNRDKINKYIIDPIIGEITSKCFPYAVSHVVLQLLIIALLIYVIMLLKKK